MTKVIKPPTRIHEKPREKSIFLAGSIEMGVAEDWQAKVTKELDGLVDIIYNPRRDDWDSSWKQEASNPNFRKQVIWELDHLLKANYVLMYFDPTTKSPISLLELGLIANKNKVIVVCPEGFYRRGNVEIVCEEFFIPFFSTLEDSLNFLKQQLKK